MTPNQYQVLALRTESQGPVVVNGDNIHNFLRNLIDFGGYGDRLKRELFYQEGSEVEPEGSVTLETANKRLLHANLGLLTEAAELAEQTLVAISGQEVDWDNVAEELGDTLWYVALGVTAADTDMATVMSANIAKLHARYPDKFTVEKAEHRDFDAESKALTAGYIETDELMSATSMSFSWQGKTVLYIDDGKVWVGGKPGDHLVCFDTDARSIEVASNDLEEAHKSLWLVADTMENQRQEFIGKESLKTQTFLRERAEAGLNDIRDALVPLIPEGTDADLVVMVSDLVKFKMEHTDAL